MWTSLIFISHLLLCSQINPDVTAFQKRQDVWNQTADSFNKIMRRNWRAVRRGSDNPRVESLVMAEVKKHSKKLKQSNAYLVISKDDGSFDRTLEFTVVDFEKIFSKMDPYRREFIENILVEKNIVGNVLQGEAHPLAKVDSELIAQKFIDLEKFESAKDRRFNSLLKDFVKRSGKNFYVFLLPSVELADASWTRASKISMEQLRNGTVRIYQERTKDITPGRMAAQVMTQTSAQLLFVRKADLSTPPQKVETWTVSGFFVDQTPLVDRDDTAQTP